MKVAIFDIHAFEQPIYEQLNREKYHHELVFLSTRLTKDTAHLAEGCKVALSFANDAVDAGAIDGLKSCGVDLLALRCAGFNHVDISYAHAKGLQVVRVPNYSPYSIAEHAVALLLAINRKIHFAYGRTCAHNFSLDGLVGFDIHGKTVGILGMGKIGSAFANIMLGFGARVIAFDVKPFDLRGVAPVSLTDLYDQSDIISLHTPLNQSTHHLIDAGAMASMKKGVYLINTGRGALIDTPALIRAIKSGHVAAAGLDVYENEAPYFFKDRSAEKIDDEILTELLTLPQVLLTAHQGFLTQNALYNIAETTLENITQFEKRGILSHVV